MKEIRKSKNVPDEYLLRVGIKGAGCAGISYLLGFDKKKSSDDVMNSNGLDILIEKKHAIYLAGMKVDFQDDTEEKGFIFQAHEDQNDPR